MGQKAKPATSASVVLRETERQEIERQVQEFLAKGGKIENVNMHQVDAKPVGRVWRPNFSGSIDTF